MSVPQSVNRAGAAQIELELPLRDATSTTRPATIQRNVAKTGFLMPESMKDQHRSGAVSRAGQHRWPQATMVVMGGAERQIFDSEMLTVSTRGNDLKNAVEERTKLGKEEDGVGKPLFPDIVGRTKQSASVGVKPKQEYRKSRLATGSPSRNLTTLPKFGKGANSSEDQKDREERKVVRNIKFWRGTTPVTRELPRDKRHERDDVDPDPDQTFITQQSIGELQEQEGDCSWHENLASPFETNKHQYYSWHMALRDRLLKHEKMRYHEAVSRISKYRQRLRQRPTAPANHNSQDVQVWKNLLQRHEESKKRAIVGNNLPTGIRMSPTKEWKPHVLGEDPAQIKPPFFGKPAALANDIAKKQFGKHGTTLPPPVTSHSKSTSKPDQESPTQNYPVHGEGLLKNEIRALSALRDARKEANEKEAKQGPPAEDDEKAQTRALLIDLKQQLKAPREQVESEVKKKSKSAKKSAKRGQTAPHRARTDLGAKLNLLLQNSGQSSRGQSRSDGRDVTSRQKSTRSRMRSQPSRQSGYRPLTRPRTYGEGNLPKIHNIIASSLWKRAGDLGEDDEEAAKVKHRLTLNGIASREPFTSGVIAIAKKHITSRGGKDGSDEGDTDDKTSLAPMHNTKDGADPLLPPKQAPLISQLRVVSKTQGDEDTGKTEAHSYGMKKRTAAQRLYTPSTVAQPKVNATSASLSKAFHKSLRENPQHMSLKLITSLSGQQQQSLNQSLDGDEVEAIVGHGHMRGKKRAVGKSKVLRIAVVEPPLTARERQRRQQAMDTSRQRLTYNATHAAVSNFTSAMLNSELALRAPSSSPVDMFFRSLYQNHHSEPMTTELWNMQKADGSLHVPVNGIKQGHPRRLEHIGGDESGDHVTATINQSDGLVAPTQSEQENLQQLTSLYNKISKAPIAPKVKDLMDLQRLYRVMKKHGDAYANGGAGYYFSQSPVNQNEKPSKNSLGRRHTDRRNLHKQPYYYYPYADNSGGNQNQPGQGGAPLYVVTGAQSLAMQRLNHGQDKRVEGAVETPVVRHRLLRFQEDENAGKWLQAKPKQPKHEITVMMPKTPGITQLEQIQEHVLH